MSSGMAADPASGADTARRRRVPRGEIQRRAILDAFDELLGRAPTVEITVKDITETAGIKRPNFYFYFQSKDEVLAELVGEAWAEWDEAIGGYHRRAGETYGAYFDRLFRISHTVWVPRGRALVAGLQAIAHDENLRTRWAELDAVLYDQLTAQMDRDAQAGLITPVSADHRGLVMTVTDMITHAFYKDRRLGSPPEDSARMLDSLKAVWLAAWGAEESTV